MPRQSAHQSVPPATGAPDSVGSLRKRCVRHLPLALPFCARGFVRRIICFAHIIKCLGRLIKVNLVLLVLDRLRQTHKKTSSVGSREKGIKGLTSCPVGCPKLEGRPERGWYAPPSCFIICAAPSAGLAANFHSPSRATTAVSEWCCSELARILFSMGRGMVFETHFDAAPLDGFGSAGLCRACASIPVPEGRRQYCQTGVVFARSSDGQISSTTVGCCRQGL